MTKIPGKWQKGQYQGLQKQKKIVLLLDISGIVIGMYFTGTLFYFLIFNSKHKGHLLPLYSILSTLTVHIHFFIFINPINLRIR